MNITIIGGGNLGTFMAATFANRGNIVTIHTSKKECFSKELEVYNQENEVLYKGRVENITNDWREAIEGADIVWITVPPHLFLKTANEIEKYSTKGQMIGVVPGAGGAEYVFGPLVEKGVIFFGLARVPSIARLKEYGKSVYMLGLAPELLIGSIPSRNAKRVCDVIQPLFKIKCRPVASYLTLTFTPSNPILHTTRLYAMFRDYIPGNHYPTNELFYEKWPIEAAEILLDCSDELQQLCKAIPMDLRDVESMQVRHNIRTPEELSNKICNIDRLKGLYSPVIKGELGYIPDFESRYFVSDFPYGIKIMIEIADLFDVPTPNMDMVWEWYERVQPQRAKQSYKLGMTKEEFIDFYV